MTDSSQKLPYGKIESMSELGRLVRDKRKQDQLTQQQLAGVANVGYRFLSELENGKETVEFGKVLKILNLLGLEVNIQPRSWKKPGEHK